MDLEAISGWVVILSAGVLLGSMFVQALKPYDLYAKWGAIIGAGVWVLAKVL